MKVIITGTTGMVGKGVLYECLDREEVTEVLVINRKSLQMDHPKLKEIIHADFKDLSSKNEHLKGYDACFFCMGVSVLGLSEEQYHDITFNITKEFADVLYELSPQMVFNYVSGAGTDSSEKGRTMWARVKGKTENYILNKGFKDAYAFRPGAIIPEKGIKSSTGWYNAVYVITRPFFPLMKKMNSVTTTTRIGDAMVNSVVKGFENKHPENIDINKMAEAC